MLSIATFVGGLLWCREIAGRWGSDLEELRTSTDGAARLSILAVWGLTLVLVGWMASFVLRFVPG